MVHGIRPRDVKVKAIMGFPEPSTKEEAMSFLAHVHWSIYCFFVLLSNGYLLRRKHTKKRIRKNTYFNCPTTQDHSWKTKLILGKEKCKTSHLQGVNKRKF